MLRHWSLAGKGGWGVLVESKTKEPYRAGKEMLEDRGCGGVGGCGCVWGLPTLDHHEKGQCWL